ncbi:MAG: YicC family protein [Clostridia bacterium]|nr:YicC family protein [Clostridia bacterium]
MFKSMTSFGRSKLNIADPELEISVEIRSVNSKNLDCSVRLPKQYSYIEQKIRPELVSHGISRGKIDVNIDIADIGSKTKLPVIDHEYVKGYLAALKELRDTYGLKDDISVMSVAADPNVFAEKSSADSPESTEQTEAKITTAVLEALDMALEVYEAGRVREGRALEDDLRLKIDGISKRIDNIERLSENDISSYRTRLEERLRSVLDEYSVKADEARILTECAIFADRVAIDEEIVRMRTHLKALYGYMNESLPVGRRFDFQLQELGREINTIGSKCSNTDIAAEVVAVKNEFEKLREQIQNVE